LPVPEGLGLDQAAALPETFFTVWTNVFDRAGLKPGETLLIHGGASGIGTTAIQLATALGSRVIVTASSEDKCAACLALGASAAINYSQDDFVEKVAELTDGQGANVILDMVGGDYIERNIKAAAIEGRIVNIAFLRGAEAKLNFMPIMLKRLTLTGSTLRPQSKEQKAAIASSLQEKVWPLISDGTIRPKMAAEFPMADAESAHRLMESHDLIGKIVLNIQGQEQES
jgi:NADPH2:quinone reductase